MDRLLSSTRTAFTLAALALLLVVAVVWAWGAATAPVPGLGGVTPVCVNSQIRPGETLRPGGVTVSVLNAGVRSGLASQTRTDLIAAGFGEGTLGNAPDGVTVDTVEVWASVPRDPAARLVRTYLGGRRNVEIVVRDLPEPGINVVVGDGFTGVTPGRAQFPVDTDVTVCGPPGLE